jgi:predicted acetyltransferase
MPLEVLRHADHDLLFASLATMGEALGIPGWTDDTKRRFLDSEGPDNFRIVVDREPRAARRVLGVLTLQRAAQFFGGVALPSAGIRCVGVATEARGRGVFRALFENTLRELREAGVEVVNLFASNPNIYRAFGFEYAGQRVLRSVPILALGESRDLANPKLRAELLGPDAVSVVRTLYTKHARRHHGWLDRSDWYWHRQVARETHSGPPRVYGFYRGDALEGYASLVQKVGSVNKIRAAEYVVDSPDAMQSLLAIVYGQRSAFATFEWCGGPADPLTACLPTPCIHAGVEDVSYMGPLEAMMLRLVSPRSALATRRYAPGLSTELHLEIDDPLFPDSAGPVRVEIADGSARVTPGGRAAVRVGPRALAALFGHHHRAHALAAAGLLTGGSDDELARIDAAFSGESVWTFDSF